MSAKLKPFYDIDTTIELLFLLSEYLDGEDKPVSVASVYSAIDYLKAYKKLK